MKQTGFFVAVIILLLVVLALNDAGSAEPGTGACPTPKLSIPADLQLVCYRGKITAMSPGANEAMVFGLPCPDHRTGSDRQARRQ